MALVKVKSVPERTANPGALEAALAQNRALPDGSAGGPWSYIDWTASGALEMSQEVQRIRA
jgi:hypothetical protein